MRLPRRLGWLLIVAVAVATDPVALADPGARPKSLSPLTNEEAWQRLPRSKPPLPAWARTLARSLPRTTAKMLELDRLHRDGSPLGPVLAGKVRWVVADTNGCAYGKRYAEADLRRAGLADADLKRLSGPHDAWPARERLLLGCARTLTRAAYRVTDDDITELLRHFGPEKVVALVHLVAHANFQDRVVLALGVEVEAGGPFAPIEARFDARARPEVPSRLAWNEVQGKSTPAPAFRPDWAERSFPDVRKALEQQKRRRSRIPVPDADELAGLPAEVKERMGHIVWSRVSLGYQPQLTLAWFDCMKAFREEAGLDRVFSSTLFWVITRSNECFY